jgi:hypothetical protein
LPFSAGFDKMADNLKGATMLDFLGLTEQQLQSWCFGFVFGCATVVLLLDILVWRPM